MSVVIIVVYVKLLRNNHRNITVTTNHLHRWKEISSWRGSNHAKSEYGLKYTSFLRDGQLSTSNTNWVFSCDFVQKCGTM